MDPKPVCVPGEVPGVESVSNPDWVALLSKCRQGDQAAWETLYAQCIPPVRARVLRMGFSEADALDVCQEALMVLARDIQSVNNPVAYAQTVAFRRCVDLIRRKRPEQAYEEHSDDSQQSAPNQALIQVWMDRWREHTYSADRLEAGFLALECLRNALDELGDPCRALLRSRFHLERSYRTIAREHAIPEPQVGVYLSRCVKRLKSMLQSVPDEWASLSEYWEAMR